MSNLTDLISTGGGGGSLPVNIALTESQTWVPPADGNICIHVIGAGGGGQGGNGGGGGGGGGYCKKTTLAVTTSGSFTVVVGVGGLGATNDATASNGGNSTVAGTGISATLTANGGTGPATNANGAGGTASNGNVNNTGGQGGFYGGGAVGVYRSNSQNSQTKQRGGGESSDAMGDPALMGYGYIVGGKGGKTYNNEYAGRQGVGENGGFLAGGGSLFAGSGSYDMFAGDGGVGGGGGFCYKHGGTANKAYGGTGGDGIVIIQYLPA